MYINATHCSIHIGGKKKKNSKPPSLIIRNPGTFQSTKKKLLNWLYLQYIMKNKTLLRWASNSEHGKTLIPG